MPRRARVTLPNISHHIIQRGNNHQACFYTVEDYEFYLTWLSEYARECECKVHSYVLMTNHVHILLTPSTIHGVGRLMKRLGQRYVQYINRTYRRSGTLWEGRFRSCLTHDESYVLACYRYIELNPVRAGIVKHPAEYQWSSFRVNAQQEKSDLISPHNLYISLGNNNYEQGVAYGGLFRSHLDKNMIDDIRKSTNGNYALGSERFKKEVELALGRRVSLGRAGRPKKPNSL